MILVFHSPFICRGFYKKILKRELSARRLAVFLLSCGVATLAAQKGGVSTNAVPPDAPGGVSGMARALPRPSADVPLAGFDVTNLMFFAIRPGTSAHELGLAWPADAQPCRYIAIFAKAAWTNDGENVGLVDTQYVRSNVVAAVDYPSLSASDSAFFAAAWHKDSDGDGLDDGEELYVYHTDPDCADCDGDGLLDGWEVNEFETDPWDPDTDGDGLPDGWEVEYDFDPTETTILTGDSDGDGLSDAEELGTVEVLQADETYWLSFSGDTAVWSTTAYSDTGGYLIDLPRPYTVHGVTYSKLRITADGIEPVEVQFTVE